MKTPILCITSFDVHYINYLSGFLGFIRDPDTLFSSIYLIENVPNMRSPTIFQIDLGNHSLQYWKNFVSRFKKVKIIWLI